MEVDPLKVEEFKDPPTILVTIETAAPRNVSLVSADNCDGRENLWPCSSFWARRRSIFSKFSFAFSEEMFFPTVRETAMSSARSSTGT